MCTGREGLTGKEQGGNHEEHQNHNDSSGFGIRQGAKAVAASPWRSQKNVSGDDCRERGEAKTWVIIALVSAALIAVLLAASGPTLALLWGQVLERFG